MYNLGQHCDRAANTPNARRRGNAAKGDNLSQHPTVRPFFSGATSPRCMTLMGPSAGTAFRSRVRTATACRAITALAAPTCGALTAPTAHTAFVRGAHMVGFLSIQWWPLPAPAAGLPCVPATVIVGRGSSSSSSSCMHGAELSTGPPQRGRRTADHHHRPTTMHTGTESVLCGNAPTSTTACASVPTYMFFRLVTVFSTAVSGGSFILLILCNHTAAECKYIRRYNIYTTTYDPRSTLGTILLCTSKYLSILVV